YGSCWPTAAQLFKSNIVVVGSDSTTVECLVEGPVQYIAGVFVLAKYDLKEEFAL
ncbi:unnamed protein product, partial [Sphenostylis stenocarpa]